MIQSAKIMLQKYFGYSSFREGQEKVISSLLSGQDTLAIMPTGAGKSMTYQVPALLFEGLTIVISPLISLMKDQVDGLVETGVPATFINSTLSQQETWSRIRQLEQGKFKLLYLAPERLENEGFHSMLQTLSIDFVAVDEAHCVSQWGHDFRPSYLHINRFLESLCIRPRIGAFTATATSQVKEDIIKLLKLREPKVFITGFDRANLSFSVIKGENKKLFLTDYLKTHSNQSGIIYAATRKEVDKLYNFLVGKGVSAGRYHAGMPDQERKKNQENFTHDEITVIVATNAFGMGIDKSNVRFVIHYNMPKNMESYYQEAGRAGRDGERAECILLFSPQDIQIQKLLIEDTSYTPERQANEYRKLQGMVDYCHTSRCLRKIILEYFGEEGVAESCANCGNCNEDWEKIDVTVDAQKIFSCIYRMQERFGITMVAEVLKGSQNKKIIDLKLDTLTTHGILKDTPLQEIKDRINFLVAEGYLAMTQSQYPVVKLTPKAVSVLKGQEKVFQKLFVKEVVPLSDAERLFEVLRILRKTIAANEGLPPYMIFPDSTLREMAKHCPVEKRALLQISGVGERKLERYGEAFLDEIRVFLNSNCTEKTINQSDRYSRELEQKSLENLRRQMPNEKALVNEIVLEGKDKIPSHMITFQLHQEGHSFKDIAIQRKLSLNTIMEHLVKSSSEGHEISWEEMIPSGHEALVLDAIRMVGGEKLKPIKEALPEDVSYFTIKAVLAKYRAG